MPRDRPNKAKLEAQTVYETECHFLYASRERAPDRLLVTGASDFFDDLMEGAQR